MTDDGKPGPEPRRGVLEKLLRASDLPPLTRLVWHVIAGHGSAKTGEVTDYPPSLNEIADGAGIERRTVIDHVNHLVKEGWLHKDPGGPGRNTRYRLSSPSDPSPPLSAPGRTSRKASSAGSRTKVVRTPAPHSAQVGTKVVRTGAPDPDSPVVPDNSSLSAAVDEVTKAGVPDDERDEIIRKIRDKYPKRGPGWWRKVAANGDLPTLIAEARAESTPTATPPPPPLCGQCEERWVEGPDGRWGHCPRCHPSQR